MAVDATSKAQGYSSPTKPTTFEDSLGAYIGDVRRHLDAVLVEGGLVVHAWIAPWAGVVECVRTTQLVAGAGAGAQNSITMTVGGTNCFLVATDGDTVLDDDVAGTSALTYPTDNLTAQADGEDRVEFAMGDVIRVGEASVGAAYGTAETVVTIARKVPFGV